MASVRSMIPYDRRPIVERQEKKMSEEKPNPILKWLGIGILLYLAYKVIYILVT